MSVDVSTVEMDVNTSFASNVSNDKLSNREQELEKMLDNLKAKFSSLNHNDPLRLRILTIAPSFRSARKIAKEFNTSR